MTHKRPSSRRGKTAQPSPEALPVKPDQADESASDARPRRRKSRPDAFDVEKLPVIDDWPEKVPITEEELQIYERYFGPVLDRIFGGYLYGTPGENNSADITKAKSEQRTAQIKSTRSRNRR